jgi:hypothetical protein
MAGNHAVSSLVARTPKTAPATPARLWEWEVKESLTLVNDRMRLDDASVRAIQEAIGTPLTGWFKESDAQALMRFGVRHGLPRSWKLEGALFDKLIEVQVAAGKQQDMIHLVADAANLRTGRDTLSIRFDPALTAASTVMFDDADLRNITVGASALKDRKSIVAAIKAQLTAPTASSLTGRPAPGPTPARLSADAAESAALVNQGQIDDRRSALAIQNVLGAPLSGRLDATTAQFIADAQAGRPTGGRDGIIDDDFFHFIVERLEATGNRDALIRVVADYKNLREAGVGDVAFSAGVAGDFDVAGGIGGSPATLTFGPSAFGAFAPTRDPAAIVHAIARGFNEAQLRHGGVGTGERAFLGAALEVLSEQMAEEPFGGTATGFVRDAAEALRAFNALSRREQLQQWAQFERVRNKVIDRFTQAGASQRGMHQQLLDDYNAVRPP